MLRIYIGFQATKFYCFPSLKPPLPPPSHLYCFSSSSSSFLLFFLLLLIFIVFPPPPPNFYCFSTSSSSSFYCFPSTTTTAITFPLFFSTTVNKRLQTTIISSVCRNVSSCQEQSWFSSILSCLSSSSATVSFTDSQSKTTTCISPSLIQYT